LKRNNSLSEVTFYIFWRKNTKSIKQDSHRYPKVHERSAVLKITGPTVQRTYNGRLMASTSVFSPISGLSFIHGFHNEKSIDFILYYRKKGSSSSVYAGSVGTGAKAIGLLLSGQNQ
jgi:hypothetical protein